MLRGLYTSASGMVTERFRQDVSANNLANLNTPGFRRQTAVFRAFSEIFPLEVEVQGPGTPVSRRRSLGPLGTGSLLVQVALHQATGELRETGNPLDLALEDPQLFFAVQTPAGLRFTRNGAVSVDEQGRLRVQRNQFLLGADGPIETPGGEVQVDAGGRVSWETGSDRIRVFRFPNLVELVPDGSNLLRLREGVDPGEPVADYRVARGFVEEANINPVREITEMMATFRAYEANQRALRIQDETLGLAVTRLGELT